MRLNCVSYAFVPLVVICIAEALSANDLSSLDGETSGDFELGTTIFCDERTHFKCLRTSQCIVNGWLCDGENDCGDFSDEDNCDGRKLASTSTVEWWTTSTAPYRRQIQNASRISGVSLARTEIIKWIMKHRIHGYDTNKWSQQVPRIASALYFGDKNFFKDGNHTGDELRYEITIETLKKLSAMDKFSTPDLALHINAMLLTCLSPRDFHGYDLVAELRQRVNSKTLTNPIEILALCNAGDTMTSSDVDKLNLINEAKNHPSWRENGALASITMSCIRKYSYLAMNMTKSIIPDLIQGQAANGSIGDVKTTALILQAMIAYKINEIDFDFDAAVKSILKSQYNDGSFGALLNSYYVLPVLSHKSLMDISTDHCRKAYRTDKQIIYDSWLKKEMELQISLSVVDGKASNVNKAWTLNVPENSSFYEIMEVLSLIDPKLKIDYSISEGKPFVSSVFGIENDAELGLYWFTYVKSLNSTEESRIVKQSPVDIIVKSPEHIILWYQEGNWKS